MAKTSDFSRYEPTKSQTTTRGSNMFITPSVAHTSHFQVYQCVVTVFFNRKYSYISLIWKITHSTPFLLPNYCKSWLLFLLCSQHVAVLKMETRYTTSGTFSRRRDERYWRASSPTPSPSELPTFVREIGLSDSCLYIYSFINLFTYYCDVFLQYSGVTSKKPTSIQVTNQQQIFITC